MPITVGVGPVAVAMSLAAIEISAKDVRRNLGHCDRVDLRRGGRIRLCFELLFLPLDQAIGTWLWDEVGGLIF